MTETQNNDKDRFDDKNLDLNESESLYNDFLQEISIIIEQGDKESLTEKLSDLRPVQIANIINILSADERQVFIELLGKDLSAEVLPEVEQSLLEEIFCYIPEHQVIEALRFLPSDDAVYLIETFDSDKQVRLLSHIPSYERLRLQRSLEYPADSAGRLMQLDFLAIPQYWSIGRTIDYLRDVSSLPDDFQEIFVIDAGFRLRGILSLSSLLRSKRLVLVKDIMVEPDFVIDAEQNQVEVAYKFSQYHLISAPVVNEAEHLVGVVRVDSVVEVIEDEVEEDIQLLAGVKDGLISDGFFDAIKSRLSWLIVNLCTAIMASIVISFFDATLSRNVSLAVLMPIVASMGGNGATQTITIAVRALARKDLLSYNLRRTVLMEVFVGLANGSVLSLLMSFVTYIWFDSLVLSLLILFAMIFNMVVAGLSGILLPVLLKRLDIDPAVASGVLATTVTDVVGFGSFLGFATFFI